MEEIIKQINRKKVQNITAWVRKTEKNNKNVEFYRQFPIKIIENINKYVNVAGKSNISG